jgi:hypothetical protein
MAWVEDCGKSAANVGQTDPAITTAAKKDVKANCRVILKPSLAESDAHVLRLYGVLAAQCAVPAAGTD